VTVLDYSGLPRGQPRLPPAKSFSGKLGTGSFPITPLHKYLLDSGAAINEKRKLGKLHKQISGLFSKL